MSISEKANDLLNKFGSAQFDFIVWNTPDNLVARDKVRQEISDYIAELEVAQRWIPVSERLPEVSGDYVVYRGGAYPSEIAYWNFQGDDNPSGWLEWGKYIWAGKPVTHWMPLPESPNDTQTETFVCG